MPVTPTMVRQVPQSDGQDRDFVLATWVLTTANPIGVAINLPDYTNKVWTIGNASGDAFGGAVCSLKGVQDTSTSTALVLNKASTGLTATSSAIDVVTTLENHLFVFPELTTVGIGATVTVRLLARRLKFLRDYK